MDTKLFQRFAPVIRSLSASELTGSTTLDDKLRMATDGSLSVCYAPFEYINPQARVVLVGITPGRTQMLNALKEARRQLDLGTDPETVLMAAKRTGAFSGAMRPNLVGLLDHVGVNGWLGIRSCDQLFGAAAHLVHTTSVLRYPVFVDGGNYNGTPNMTRHPLLREQLLMSFAEEARALPAAVFVPLGDKVAEALHFVADHGLLDRSRILDGLPHPSGANAERIAYFMGRKMRSALSSKTDPDKLDAARERAMTKVSALANALSNDRVAHTRKGPDEPAQTLPPASAHQRGKTTNDQGTPENSKRCAHPLRERTPPALDLAPILEAFEEAGCRATKSLDKVVELHTPAGKVLYLIKTTSRPGNVQLMAHPEHRAMDLIALPGIAEVGEAHGFHSNMSAFPKRINKGKTPTAHGWPMTLETESAIRQFVPAFDRLLA